MMANTYAHYARMLQDSIPLSRTEEEKLLVIAQTSPEKESNAAEQRLLKANLRFVFQVARRFAHVGTDEFDIAFISGMHGFIRGIRGFDRSLGLKLISYAIWWIKREILTDLHIDKSRFSGLIGMRDRRKKLVEELKELEGLDTKEVQEKQGWLAEISTAMGPPAIRIGTEHRTAHGDMETSDVVDPNSLSAFFEFDTTATNRKIVDLSLSGVEDEVDRKLISLYYGLDGGLPHTYDDLGHAMKQISGRVLSKERIRQRLVRSLTKMRRKLERNNIKHYDMCHTHDFST